MGKKKLNIPVQPGEKLELTVETLASSGDGLSRYKGYTLFIPLGVPGDSVIGEVIKITPRFGVVRIVEMKQFSPDRVKPPCPVFPQCGGCKLQDLPYERQLEFKKQVVIDNLTRIGKLRLPETVQIIPASRPYRYRNKASFAVQEKAGKLQIGFFRQGTHEVEDSSECEALVEPINWVKEIVRELLISHRIPIFDETSHKGFMRGLIVRHSVVTQETLVGLVTTEGSFYTTFIEELKTKTDSAGIPLQGIVQNFNPWKTNIILGKHNKVLYGRSHIIEKLGNIEFHLSLPSFFQVNHWQTIELYDLVKEWAGPNSGPIMDAYCGIGGISFWLAEHSVTGIEEVPEAIEDAVKSALLNNIETCRFLSGPIENHIQDLSEWGEVSTLILDPPRKGCSKEVIQAVLENLNPKKIIYVSCNPATLARDLSKLCEESYALIDLKVVDMFPQTQHIETAVFLEAVQNQNPRDQEKA
ncbi:MAG: 23S rRNA (uracil(1939)-C(5))-methyltransferase RlmD [Nitrospinota bacterium]|nr:23S rRNA (uracil(1939)-C(5))-methyltransferase RlmD [Nitrospinota bacterium]